MKKRLLSFFFCVIIIAGLLPLQAAAAGSMHHFSRGNTYQSGLFTDVKAGSWYEEYVQTAYEYGLVNGITLSTFEPDSYLRICEAIKLAVCIHSIYYSGTADFTNDSPWYRTYVDYALENGIIDSEFSDYNAYATRSQFAEIFARALPSEALPEINSIADGDIPDVASDADEAWAVYPLYRAGILTGGDEYGRFYPDTNIKRSEVATIASRMANNQYRRTYTLTQFDVSANDYLEVSSTSVTLEPGGSTAVTVSDPDKMSARMEYVIEDTSVIICSFGFWYNENTQVPFYINALAAGTTAVMIYMYDEDNNIIDYVAISVTVSEGIDPSSIDCYDDYDTVSDYGTCSGASVYDWADNGGYAYFFYRRSDHATDMDAAAGDYAELLEAKGFEYYYSQNIDGYQFESYSNSETGIVVLCGPADIDGHHGMKVIIRY